MATGDIGALIDLLSESQTSDPHIIKIAGDYYAVIHDIASGSSARVLTTTIDSAGVIPAAWLGTYNYNVNSSGRTYITHVSGTVYALWYCSNTLGRMEITTINISDTGVIGAEIATFIFDTSAFLRWEPLHIAGSIWAILYSASNIQMRVRTISISNDGLTIANVAVQDDGIGSSSLSCFAHVNGTTYLAARVDNTNKLRLVTYTITAAGAITILQQTQLDATGAAAFVVAFKVGFTEPAVFGISYCAPNTATFTLKTLPVNTDGTFGAVVDTDTTLFTGNPFHIIQVGVIGDVYLAGYHVAGDSKLTFRTFHVASDGTIGLVQDTLTTPTETTVVANPYFLRVGGNIYATVHVGGSGAPLRLRTFDVETSLSVTYPSDSTVRISSIRHIYRPGSYRLEATLGGISTDAELVQRQFEEPTIAPVGIQPTPVPYGGPMAPLPPPVLIPPVYLPQPGMPGYPIAVPGYPLLFNPETARELQKALAEDYKYPAHGSELPPDWWRTEPSFFEGLYKSIVTPITETVTNWWHTIFGPSEEE